MRKNVNESVILEELSTVYDTRDAFNHAEKQNEACVWSLGNWPTESCQDASCQAPTVPN